MFELSSSAKRVGMSIGLGVADLNVVEVGCRNLILSARNALQSPSSIMKGCMSIEESSLVDGRGCDKASVDMVPGIVTVGGSSTIVRSM